MGKPVIAIKTHQRDYEGLVNLGTSVYESLLTNTYITTTSPPLSVLKTSIDETLEALFNWGMQGNYGSKVDLLELREKAFKLSLNLKSISQSVQTSAQQIAGADFTLLASILSTTGFALKKTKAPQGRLGQVEDFRTLIQRNVALNQVKLKWEKPLNVTAIGNVKVYKIYMGTTLNPQDAVVIAAITKTSFIYTNNSDALQQLTFWIVPVNTNGDGIRSKSINVRILNR